MRSNTQKAADLISQKPVWIDLSQSLRDAEQAMAENHTSGLLVRDATGRAVGVFSKTDLETYYRTRHEQCLQNRPVSDLTPAGQTIHPQQERIESWVSPHIISVDEDASVQKVIREMLKHHVHRVFVTTRVTATYKGVITMMDILKNFVRGSMRVRKALPALLLMGWCAMGYTATDVAPAALRWALDPASTLSLEGDSTLHKYHSKATQLQAVLETKPGAAGGLAELIQNGDVSRLEFTVVIAGLKSGKGQLDRNMSNTLNAKEHPAITYRMTRYELKPGVAGGKKWLISAPGILNVAGKDKDVVLSAQLDADAEHAEISGEQELLMTDFGVKPPVLMMGALKTADKVVIHYDIVIAKSQQ